MKERGDILKKAHKIINGERQDTYGNPEDSFKLIAKYWTVYLNSKGFHKTKLGTPGLSPREVAEMMSLFKIARMSGQGFHEDSFTDCIGYLALAADMGEKNG